MVVRRFFNRLKKDEQQDLLNFLRSLYVWSLNRLFLDRPSLLIGICDFMPPCGRCQLYGCSQIASSSALSSILEWFDVGRRSTTLDHWTPFFPALGISQSV